jgi:hypothetical protein
VCVIPGLLLGPVRAGPASGAGRTMTAKACCWGGQRGWLRQRGITAVTPVQGGQQEHRRNRGRAGGRPRRAAGAGRHAPR